MPSTKQLECVEQGAHTDKLTVLPSFSMIPKELLRVSTLLGKLLREGKREGEEWTRPS